jgi:hypothetical protein
VAVAPGIVSALVRPAVVPRSPEREFRARQEPGIIKREHVGAAIFEGALGIREPGQHLACSQWKISRRGLGRWRTSAGARRSASPRRRAARRPPRGSSRCTRCVGERHGRNGPVEVFQDHGRAGGTASYQYRMGPRVYRTSAWTAAGTDRLKPGWASPARAS